MTSVIIAPLDNGHVLLGGNAVMAQEARPRIRRDGAGYLAGTFPSGITSVDGAPTPATIRVLYRPQGGAHADGVVVETVVSAADGTWQVGSLDPSVRYDVVCRLNGHNDMIWSNVTPAVD